MRTLLIIAFSLCLNVPAFAQKFPFEIFKARTIKEVVSTTAKTIRSDDSMFVATDQLESKMTVTFTGKSRPILKERRGFIKTWAGTLNHPVDYADLYQHEYLYKEGSTEYWLPTQEPVTKYFEKEMKEGDQMTLYLISIGAYRNKKEVDCVLLVEEYQKSTTTA